MNRKLIVLASQSPRRKEILEKINLPFLVDAADVNEEINFKNDIREELKKIAFKKANTVAKRHRGKIILAADTVVMIDGKVLGKPKTEEEAAGMLKRLSGRKHEVLTGVCLLDDKNIRVECVVCEVEFHKLMDEEIERYIETKEPMDKAGAYGIQGFASCYIKGIQGDYYSVMGLPISWVYHELKNFIEN